MSNPNPWPGKRPPIIEQLAAELQGTGGTISTKAHGAVYRGNQTVPWDMATEWRGAELTNYDWRKSNWSKTIMVRFFVEPPESGGRLASFALHLHPPLTDEEISRIAETYLQVLNMRRVT